MFRIIYALVLTLDVAFARAGSIDQSYVYVFAIDSSDKSTLLFPLASTGNVENHPLSCLLSRAGASKCGLETTTPTDWSIERLTIQSAAAGEAGEKQ